MSQKCGACLKFKQKMLPDLENILKRDTRINLKILDFPQMAIPKDSKDFHPGLRNGFVTFFPTMILFPGNLWNDKKSQLKGVPKHDNPASQIDYSKNSILSWIDTTLNKHHLFSNNNDLPHIDTNSSNSLIRKLPNGNYRVPTHGTYTKYKNTKIDNEML
jgi:hypothetical protein